MDNARIAFTRNTSQAGVSPRWDVGGQGLDFRDMFYYTYVLLSSRDNKFYVGFSVDLRRRIAEHNSGKVKATRNRQPLRLVYYEACLSREDACRREQEFKSGFGRRNLKNRLMDFLVQEKIMRV